MGAAMINILEYLRIIRVLAWKDIRQVLKNKNVLVLFFSVCFLIFFYRSLPSLSAGRRPPPVLVYDAGKSALTETLKGSPAFTAQTDIPSIEELKRRMARGDEPELGLVIPADFDRRLAEGDAPVLQGYVMYWMSGQEAASLIGAVEAEIERILGTPVSIQAGGNVVAALPDEDGAGAQASMALIFALIMLGISLVPQIMLDEKRARTLEVLLVSPARAEQVAAGKGLAGLVFSGLVVALAAAINGNLVVHWGVFAAAALAFSLVCVMLGLILATCTDTRAQFSLWVWVLIIPATIPLVLYLMSDLFPDFIGRILPVFPSVTALMILRYAYADPISYGVPLLGLAWLVAWIAVELGAVAWLLRRRDRAEESRIDSSRAAGRKEEMLTPAPPVPAAAKTEQGGQAEAGGFRAALRIVLAIAAKDIREAYRNRLILSLLLGMAFIAINGAILPMLINWRSLPTAVVFDEGRSAAVRALAARDDSRVIISLSRGEMEAEVVQSLGTCLGLVIPPDFDQRLQAGGEIDLEGAAAHWADEGKLAQIIALFEGRLGGSASAEVRIIPAAGRLYPTVESGGMGLVNLIAQFMVLIAVGFGVVPLLLVEEKEAHTMDVLSVSPAEGWHILAGKTLAGFAYCLATGLVIALLNLQLIVHWELLALTILLGSFFVVSAGLLIGTLAGSPTSAAFWGSPLILISVLPVVLQLFQNDSWPAWLTAVLPWLPMSVILRLFRLAVAGDSPARMVWQAVAVLGGTAAALYLAVVWLTRRRENA
jgi:ABC-type Na+ efflux pump permease subunit